MAADDGSARLRPLHRGGRRRRQRPRADHGDRPSRVGHRHPPHRSRLARVRCRPGRRCPNTSASTWRRARSASWPTAPTRSCRGRSRAASRPRSTIRRSAWPSWIIDRFHAWCDFDGDLESSFSRDDLLTNVMLYWVTQTIGSSMFNYYAETQSPSLTPRDHVERPVGLALFPKDIGGVPPRSFAERTLNVQRWTEMPRGGHFAALEEPELFALRRDRVLSPRCSAAVSRPRGSRAMSAQPFEIRVPQSTLDDLQRASRVDAPGSRTTIQRPTGTPARAPRTCGSSSTTGDRRYDCRAHEAQLNRFAHFRATVGGAAVHFIHERAAAKRRCRSCSRTASRTRSYRFLKLIPLLTDPAAHGGDPATPSTSWCPACPATPSRIRPSGPAPRSTSATCGTSS